HLIERVGVEAAEAFVDEQRPEFGATAAALSYLTEAEREGEAREEAFAARQGRHWPRGSARCVVAHVEFESGVARAHRLAQHQRVAATRHVPQVAVPFLEHLVEDRLQHERLELDLDPSAELAVGELVEFDRRVASRSELGVPLLEFLELVSFELDDITALV